MPSGDFWLATPESTHARGNEFADRAFQFRLAERLGRTREELLHGGPGHRAISNAEYEEWRALATFDAKYAEQKKGAGK